MTFKCQWVKKRGGQREKKKRRRDEEGSEKEKDTLRYKPGGSRRQTQNAPLIKTNGGKGISCQHTVGGPLYRFMLWSNIGLIHEYSLPRKLA